ncbi:MAG: class I mannose-6-phosphate isomerase, partial [Eubacteriales bacterium]|nr:class I mannose-6-phosphate isomerase [Eubacteriales bacterium]
RPLKEKLRRCYYVDFESALNLKKKLWKENSPDYYISGDGEDDMRGMPWGAFSRLMSSLVRYPFRCKPVYLEGIWGGTYIKRLRKLPEKMINCAWVFDLIPMEVSILVDTGKTTIDFPFYSFVLKEGERMLGSECIQKFNGYFPIRFNYDDTFHGSGNMSIQVHPGDKYIKENFHEHGRQDESYYVVATGHGAKTYIGFKNDADFREFIDKIKESEKSYTKVEYNDYVNSVPSKPGAQFMIPAGTIHASGRNQVILEIGSLTVGSYTFKLYDYLRADMDGIPRPIHTYHGERVLREERRADWVSENIMQQPRIIRQGNGWKENVAGEHELLYFSLRTYEFEKEIESCTDGKFHVLTLVDGEKVRIESLDNPEFCREQEYLDVVVVPANIGRYMVRNLGNQPVVMHKTMLK